MVENIEQTEKCPLALPNKANVYIFQVLGRKLCKLWPITEEVLQLIHIKTDKICDRIFSVMKEKKKDKLSSH